MQDEKNEIINLVFFWMNCELLPVCLWCRDAHKCFSKIIQGFRIKSYKVAVFCIEIGNVLIEVKHFMHTCGWPEVGAVVQRIEKIRQSNCWCWFGKSFFFFWLRVGVKASVVFSFALQTVYSTHFVHTILHCCTTRLCNESKWKIRYKYSDGVNVGKEGLVGFT